MTELVHYYVESTISVRTEGAPEPQVDKMGLVMCSKSAKDAREFSLLIVNNIVRPHYAVSHDLLFQIVGEEQLASFLELFERHNTEVMDTFDTIEEYMVSRHENFIKEVAGAKETATDVSQVDYTVLPVEREVVSIIDKPMKGFIADILPDDNSTVVCARCTAITPKDMNHYKCGDDMSDVVEYFCPSCWELNKEDLDN